MKASLGSFGVSAATPPPYHHPREGRIQYSAAPPWGSAHSLASDFTPNARVYWIRLRGDDGGGSNRPDNHFLLSAAKQSKAATSLPAALDAARLRLAITGESPAALPGPGH